MTTTSLSMIHDTSRGSQHQVTELTGWQQISHPLLDISNLDGETRRNNTALVQATVQLNDDLSGTVVVNNLKLTDVSVLLHDGQELDDDLGARTHQNLALALAFGVAHGFEAIVED